MVYFRCLNEQRRDGQSKSFEICRHFMQTRHGLTDLAITLVDALPPNLNINEAVDPAIRTRLESIWIGRLQAE